MLFLSIDTGEYKDYTEITMASILNEDVGPTNVQTLAIAGITKYAGERAMTSVVGNANFVSGGVKLGTALVVDSFMDNNMANGVALGIGVDGIEDLFTATLGQTELGAGSQMGSSRSVM